ncbi:uncharacterized protein N7518_001738 [Penicillium psychrosexuale]|uniref:uncharacterized protein n=1 Tax=Penicillium psychrosexuale TaxID=1002107 RepID=UPI002544FF70|nr:uncharacterized protein N7518_001738 [Penicillium psychrosexuale]KAJ5799670.1 hypothetical protein N7518_001738 [Penicillium psychrosexuale]
MSDTSSKPKIVPKSSSDSTSEKLQPWKAHWPQSTMSTAHLDSEKFARALGGRKGASPNQDSFVDGTKVLRVDDFSRFLERLKQ